MSKADICVVVPAYNEERTVEAVLREVLRHCEAEGMDLVVVDDGSTDRTAARVRETGALLLEHGRNRGKGAAIRTAIAWLLERGYEAAVFLDADGQHLPSELPRFGRCFRQGGADLVVGTRMGDNASMPLVRKWSNRTSSLLVSVLAGVRVTDSQSGYRLLSRRLLEGLRDRGGAGFDFESEMIIDAARSGMAYAEVPISCVYGDKKSHYHPVRDSAQFLRLVVRKGWELLARHRCRGR